uniref:Uncharacterized protein n=1 Tax=Arundo donax TaxID=35708 RepID=A0A0A8YEN9_ARUDO
MIMLLLLTINPLNISPATWTIQRKEMQHMKAARKFTIKNLLILLSRSVTTL